ncbi:MAG: ribosome silencing factor [Epulopiscium sp. Nele67-Bin005]|nr:MAG: ribosome silencing factor [Epulopiscium sp. Nele67-Bin005]
MEKRSYELAERIAYLLDKKKLEQVEIIDVEELTTLTDIFVIAICSSVRQTKATAEELEYMLQEDGYIAHQKEGYDSSTWILLDYLGVIVHILYREDAEFYGIQRLWKDGNLLQLKKTVM